MVSELVVVLFVSVIAMSLHGYSDGEYEYDNENDFTFISKLDLSHPLHFHPIDSSTLTIVSIKLKGTENYNVWSCAMLLALWVNFFQKGLLNSLTQNGSPVAEYFNKLNDFKKHNQLMKLMQFLMGLDETYMQLRSNIFSRDPLPDAKGAYVLISSEESHRSQTFGNTSRPNNNTIRPNKNGNRRNAGGPSLVYEHCGFNGHIMDICFKLIGYPSDFGKRNNSSNKANQHLTYTNKDLVNVIDISYLRIKVSHPNGTKALITKIIHEGPDTSNDDNGLNANDQNDGRNSPEPSSPTFDLFEDDLGHPQGGKWVFKTKYKSNGEIERYKARYNVRGYNQNEGIDFDETFSLIVKIIAVSKSDYYLFTKSENENFLALLVSVDNITVIGNDFDEIQKFKEFLRIKFQIKDLGKTQKSKKQHTLAKSSAEAEYRAMASVTSKVTWILKILKDLEWDQVLPVDLFCDSQAAIKMAANPIFHERTKHLEIDLHFVREKSYLE
nr:ribonuclease H-like domain-containing protein [Tanacetum cinerariifolium]